MRPGWRPQPRCHCIQLAARAPPRSFLPERPHYTWLLPPLLAKLAQVGLRPHDSLQLLLLPTGGGEQELEPSRELINNTGVQVMCDGCCTSQSVPPWQQRPPGKDWLCGQCAAVAGCAPGENRIDGRLVARQLAGDMIECGVVAYSQVAAQPAACYAVSFPRSRDLHKLTFRQLLGLDQVAGQRLFLVPAAARHLVDV